MHWGWGFGGVGMILWWVLIIGLPVAIIYALMNNSNRMPRNEQAIGRSPKNAIEILKERYAKGEISEEEFKKMRENLRDD